VSTAPAAPRPTARAEIEDLRAAKLDLEAKAEELLRSGTVKPVGAARDGGIPAARHDWPASLGEGSSPSVRGRAATRRAQCLGVTPPRSINRS
jgi:hypothetical protein